MTGDGQPAGKRRVVAYRTANNASRPAELDAEPNNRLIAVSKEFSRTNFSALLALARKSFCRTSAQAVETRAGAMFAAVGMQIARQPRVFILAGALLSLLSLGAVRIQLKDRIRDGYTPENAPSRYETAVMREFFNASADPILTILLVQARDGGSMLRPAHVAAAARLSRHLMSDFRPFPHQPNLTYAALCDPFCDANLALETFADTLENEVALLLNRSSSSDLTSLTYPVAQISGYSVYLERMFFSVRLKNASVDESQLTPEQIVTNMEDVKVVMMLFRGDRSSPEREKALSDWELAVYDYLYETAVEPLLDVEAIGTEILDREMLEDGRRAMPYFAGGFLATVAFVFVTVIGRAVAARNFDAGKIWCAAATLVSPTLAISLTYGCLSLLGLRVNSFLLILPYLVFGIANATVTITGVDDSFLIMHAWFEAAVAARQIAIEPKARAAAAAADARRLADVLTDVGPSITVTTLTNVISFAVGAFSPTPEIRLFCFGTTLSLTLVFLLQFLFLCPVLELTKRYETRVLIFSNVQQGAVHDARLDDYLPAAGVKNEQKLSVEIFKSVPSSADFFRTESVQSVQSDAPTGRLERLFECYCSLMSSRRFALVLVVVMAGYWMLAVAGTLRIQTRLDASKVLPEGSRIQRTNLVLDQCVWNDYLPVTVFVNTEFDLTNKSQVSDFDDMIDEFEKLPKCRGAASTMNWLRDYRKFLSAKPSDEFDLLGLLSDLVLPSDDEEARGRREIAANGAIAMAPHEKNTVIVNRKDDTDAVMDDGKDNVDRTDRNESATLGEKNGTIIDRSKNEINTITAAVADQIDNVDAEATVVLEHNTDVFDAIDVNRAASSDTVDNGKADWDTAANKTFTTITYEEGNGEASKSQEQLDSCRLREFLDSPFRRHWNGFLRLDEDQETGENGVLKRCPKIRGFMVTVAFHDTVAWTDRIALMLRWREIASRHEAALNATVWEQNSMFVDQMLSLKATTIQTGTLTLCCMIIICALFVSNPFCVAVASAVIASICVGAFGFLSFMGFDLDPITMAALLMSIGLSVDYTAHVAYHFQQSGRVERAAGGLRRRVALTGRHEKLRHALRAVGWPLVQAAVSTALCVMPLFFIKKYVASVFFTTICVVTALGLAHGLVVLPCALRHLPAACSSANFYAAYCTGTARRSYALAGGPPCEKKTAGRRVSDLID